MNKEKIYIILKKADMISKKIFISSLILFVGICIGILLQITIN